MADPMILGSIVIDLSATSDGELIVSSRIEGTLQYVTALGMLEMAKETLDAHLEGGD